ncbi:MAG TPA: AraC family transcriptional regulator [Rudaea sp.]|nr:AraC family transcriptional regulator [Rudaea sp.]
MDISADLIQRLFDSLPDVVFFVKDARGCYTHANLTLVRRLGLKRRDQVVGRRASELFAPALGSVYGEQDKRVLAGERLDNHLEVHLFPNRAPGWCLTCKEPLYARGSVCGVVGFSRDLGQLNRGHPTYDRLRAVLAHLKGHYGERVRIRTLADIAGVSVAQLERHIRRVFQLTPQQLLAKFRIEAAMQMLAHKGSVAAVGHACGFSDQSAFTRQFRAMVGMTPRDYRLLLASVQHDADAA